MGVYNRFGSKTGLVAAVLVRGFDGLADAIRVREDADPAGRLSACGRSYRRFALANPQHYEAMFGSGVDSADRAAAFSEELKGHATAAFGVLVDEVSRAMDAGVLRRDEPREAAQVIWSAVHGAVALELAGVTQVEDPDAAYERLLVALVSGLG
jgi:AcrR family transcriptional regulator